MTNEHKLELIKRHLQNTQKSSTLGKNVIIRATEAKLIRRESQDGSEGRVLTLRIKTESESPIYEDWFGDKYTEIIGANAYDESLEQVARGEKVIHSYADHDMKTTSVISSTNREGTKLYKDDNNDYIMEMILDKEIPLHRTIIKLMENKEIEANSFIFQPEEIEIVIDESRDDIDYKVVQKKGNLLSVDPVMYAFYTQNKVEMKGKDMSAEEKALEEARKAKEAEEKAAAEKAAAEEAKKQAEQEQKAIDEARAKEEEAKKAAEEAEANKEQTEIGRVVEKHNEENKYQSSEAEKRAAIEKAAKAEEENKVLRAKILEANEKAKKGKEMTKEERKSIIGSFLLRGNVQSTKENLEKLNSAIAERNKQVIAEFGVTEDELHLFNLRASDLTGADASTGALIIPVSTDPNVVGQDVIVMPEFDGASRLSMSGLEEKKVPVDVDSMGVAVSKEEGADAGELAGTVVKVQFKPTRYPVSFNYNPLLASHANFVSQKTTNAQNSIKRAWLKGYYDTIIAGAGTAFAGNEATYAGGATSESNIESTTSAAITQADLDKMILDLEADYGTISEGQFKFEMKPETWAAIVADARTANNAALIRVANGKTIYGQVEVIVRKQYPDAIAAGKFPVTLSKKSNTKIYGGVMIVKNSTEVKFLAELNTRLVTGRGEAKLCDPHYTTRTLKIKA